MPWKIKYTIHILFLLLWINTPRCVYAQSSVLLKTLQKAKEDTNKVELLYNLAEEGVFQKEYKRAIAYAVQAKKLAQKLAYREGIGKSNFLLGKAYKGTRQYSIAINHYLEGVSIYKSLQNSQGLSDCYHDLGFLYQEQNAYKKAIEYFMRSYKIEEANHHINQKITILQSIAFSYHQLKNYDKATTYYTQALELYEQQQDNKKMVEILGKLSNISMLKGNYQEALRYNLKIIDINRWLNDALSIASSLNNIGYLYKKIGDKKKALHYFQQALNLNKNLNVKNLNKHIRERDALFMINMGVAYSHLGEYHKARNAYEDAILIYKRQNNEIGVAKVCNYLAASYYVSGNIESTITQAKKGAALAEKLTKDEIAQTSYKILSEVYKRTGDFKNSQLYYKKYLDIKQKLVNKERVQEQGLLQNQIDIEKKENEIKTLIADKEKQVLTVRQLKLEKVRQTQNLKLKEQELALLKRNQELHLADLKNQQLEKERVQQLLLIAEQKAKTEKEKREAERQKQEAEKQKLLTAKEKAERLRAQKAREVAEKDQKIKALKLEDEEVLRRNMTYFLALAVLIIALIMAGLINNRRQRQKLSRQNEEISYQKTELEMVNGKLKANEVNLQRSYRKIKESEKEVKLKNQKLQASEQELRYNMEQLEANKEEIEAQKEALETAYQKIEEKNTVFTQSIQYAEKIQHAILPSEQRMKSFFEDYFILYKPRDVVSGDFYWATKRNNKIFFACVDCTGHGVPGAFMSLIGSATLNRIIKEQHIYETDLILEKLHYAIQRALRQRETRNHDGMDLSICSIEVSGDDLYVQFSGAKSSIFCDQNGKITELKGDRKAIGGIQEDEEKFSSHIIQLKKGDTIYMTTDGYLDAPNPRRKKFGKRRFVQLLEEVASLPLEMQHKRFEEALNEHHQTTMQRDDITLIGLRF